MAIQTNQLQITSSRTDKLTLTVDRIGRILAKPVSDTNTSVVSWIDINNNRSTYTPIIHKCSEDNRHIVLRAKATLPANSCISQFQLQFKPFFTVDNSKYASTTLQCTFQAYLYISESYKFGIDGEAVNNNETNNTAADRIKYWNTYGNGRTADATQTITVPKSTPDENEAATLTFTKYNGTDLMQTLQNDSSVTKTYYIFIYLSINKEITGYNVKLSFDNYNLLVASKLYTAYVKYIINLRLNGDSSQSTYNTDGVDLTNAYYNNNTNTIKNIELSIFDYLNEIKEENNILKIKLTYLFKDTDQPKNLNNIWKFIGWANASDYESYPSSNSSNLYLPNQGYNFIFTPETTDATNTITLDAIWIKQLSNFWMVSNTGRRNPDNDTDSTYNNYTWANPWGGVTCKKSSTVTYNYSDNIVLRYYYTKDSDTSQDYHVYMYNSQGSTTSKYWIKADNIVADAWNNRVSGGTTGYSSDNKVYQYIVVTRELDDTELSTKDVPSSSKTSTAFEASSNVVLYYHNSSQLPIRLIRVSLDSAFNGQIVYRPTFSDDINNQCTITILDPTGQNNTQYNKTFIDNATACQWASSLPEENTTNGSIYEDYTLKGYYVSSTQLLANDTTIQKAMIQTITSQSEQTTIAEQLEAMFNNGLVLTSTNWPDTLTNVSLYSIYYIPAYEQTLVFTIEGSTTSFKIQKHQANSYIFLGESYPGKITYKYYKNNTIIEDEAEFWQFFATASKQSTTTSTVKVIAAWEYTIDNEQKQTYISKQNYKELFDILDSNTSQTLTLSAIISEAEQESYNSDESLITINLNGHLMLNRNIKLDTNYMNLIDTSYSNNYTANALHISTNNSDLTNGLDISLMNHGNDNTNNKVILSATSLVSLNDLDNSFKNEAKTDKENELYAHHLNLSGNLTLHNVDGNIYVTEIPSSAGIKGQIVFVPSSTAASNGWKQYTPYIYIGT